MDSFEDFGSHWARGMRFGRPKLKIAAYDTFENPKWANPAPDWDFGQILMYFLKILNLATLLVAITP